jgi:hypothetical protein
MLKNCIIIFAGVIVVMGVFVFSLPSYKNSSNGENTSLEQPLLKTSKAIELSDVGSIKESGEEKTTDKLPSAQSASEQLQAKMDIVSEELRHIDIEAELNNSTTSPARRQEIIGKMNLYAKMMGEYARLEAAEIKREVQ